jgi:1,4-dihydroxy-2-naphthoate octaprenyltransferase
MHSLQHWILATRPKTLPAAVGPVLVGTALALSDDGFHFPSAAAALAIALLLQIGVNLANDYFDGIRGIDTQERLGPMRLTQSGLISPGGVKYAMLLTFGIAGLVGSYLLLRGGWPVAAVGIAAVMAAVSYSGGPLPLASHGLGDLFVFVFFGPVAVCGTYYVQTIGLTWKGFFLAVPVGFQITAILVVNNLRDIRTDRMAGKNTLAVRLGEHGSKIEYAILLGTTYAVLPFFWSAGWASVGILLPLLSVPWAIFLIQKMWRSEISAGLNVLLAHTAKLTLGYNLLLSIGIVLG